MQLDHHGPGYWAPARNDCRQRTHRGRLSPLVTPNASAYMSDAAGRMIHASIAFHVRRECATLERAAGGALWRRHRSAAALIKIFGPFHAADRALPVVLEIGVAVVGFALLCAGAALLRNLLAQRLQDTRH